jgi:hypothetical protein
MKRVRWASVTVALFLLTSAATAYAEGAWVLWTRMEDTSSHNDKWKDWSNGGGEAYPTYSRCWAKIYQYTGVAEAGSLADWYNWMRGLAQYSKRKDTLVTTVGSVLVVPPRPLWATEWRCIPDTIDPRGPKAK